MSITRTGATESYGRIASAPHLLVAEDNEDDAALLGVALRRSGMTEGVQFVKDGQEVMDYLQGKPPFEDRARYPIPSLLVLDLKMPLLDGFGVLEAMPPERMPLVVFVTAYDQFAVKAFEAQALDYLLKPFRRERFRASLERVRRSIAARDATAAASVDGVGVSNS